MKKIKESKKSNGIGLLALGGVAAYALTRTKTKPPPEPGDGSIIVTLRPGTLAGAPDYQTGAFDPTSSVVEGQAVIMSVDITNKSTQAGVGIRVALSARIKMQTTDGTIMLPERTETYTYNSQETKRFQYQEYVPFGKSGQSVGGYVTLLDPLGNVIASGAGTMPIASISILAKIGTVYMWNTPLNPNLWTQITNTQNPVMPNNSVITIGLGWQNTSNIPILGHLAMEVTQPNLAKINPTVLSGQDQTATINAIMTGVVFNPFTASQAGTYHIKLTLATQPNPNVILDTFEWNMVVAAPDIIYAGTINIS